MSSDVQALNAQLFDHTFKGEIDPYALFDQWLALASEKEPMANALSLATVDGNGMPDVRVVLLKERTQDGFTFYTNTRSSKGEELAANPKAALGFFWKSLNWQVRIRGAVVPVSAEVADAYYKSRPLGSRIGAHASEQSRPLQSKQELMDRVAQFEAQYGEDVPRPAHWSGYTIEPIEIEFWCDGEYRLHDRVRFTRENSNQPWTRQRLFP
ncbi:pyridoxamine 5'-phosphate oxidase [Maritalea porphyrae]|uniref:pyridoxamine 5'-phosphate oxidase n=1 Tax=Maritalea porphyrae TaxID=880732 RepID=UPI0022B0578D|nr:pyridoxamine 5'-phosphate oxidase [Maritalea porphyrae]MCZ4271309.1 pyridoxamine 5'-phosphate oxidase [Maritalea porphyrae]